MVTAIMHSHLYKSACWNGAYDMSHPLVPVYCMFARSSVLLPQPIPWGRHQASHFTKEERFPSAIEFPVTELLKPREIRSEVPDILALRQGVCAQWWLPLDWFRLWDDVTAQARRDTVSWTVHEAGADLRKQGWEPVQQWGPIISGSLAV